MPPRTPDTVKLGLAQRISSSLHRRSALSIVRRVRPAASRDAPPSVFNQLGSGVGYSSRHLVGRRRGGSRPRHGHFLSFFLRGHLFKSLVLSASLSHDATEQQRHVLCEPVPKLAEDMGLTSDGSEVVRSRKVIYRLINATLRWYEKFKTRIESVDSLRAFWRSVSEDCVTVTVAYLPELKVPNRVLGFCF